MNVCLVCLEPLRADSYHPKCVRGLFGTSYAPSIDVELAKLHTVAMAMIGHTSLSGVQRKISLRLETESRTLRVATDGGRFILKPQAQTFPHLPENEHVTMRMAARAGIAIPPCGLLALKDGSLAYIARRFDRTDAGKKLLQEDFCQLAEKSPKEKYDGSAELCARIVQRFASAPGVDAAKLFRLMVFTWWTGNGDMHLKNFSLLCEEDGNYRLSPAYDLLCTRLILPDDLLALSVDGNKKNVTRKQWMTYAAYCQLPPRAAERVLREIAEATEDCTAMIERSALPEEMKEDYAALLRKRAFHLSD
ncbi:MAG: HipA domain-containing protein [Polyangiaceae bacterium]